VKISETARDKAIVTIEHQQEVMALYRTWTFSMTFTGFQRHGIFEVEYLKNGASTEKVYHHHHHHRHHHNRHHHILFAKTEQS